MAKRTPPSPESSNLVLVETSRKGKIRRTKRLDEFPAGGPLVFRETVDIPDNAPPDRLLATYEVRDRRNADRVVHAYNLRQRVRVYGPQHLVLTGFGAQELDRYRLAAGIRFLEVLKDRNSNWSGFFSGFSFSHDGIHFQYVEEILPIWNADCPRQFAICHGQALMGQIDWYFRAWCFESENPAIVVDSAWMFIKDSPTAYDLLFCQIGGRYRCIPVRRRARKATALCVAAFDDYRDIGGMELSGMILTRANTEMTEKLKSLSEDDCHERMKLAYEEVCL